MNVDDLDPSYNLETAFADLQRASEFLANQHHDDAQGLASDVNAALAFLGAPAGSNPPFAGRPLLREAVEALVDRIDPEYFPVTREQIMAYVEHYEGRIEERLFEVLDGFEGDILARKRAEQSS